MHAAPSLPGFAKQWLCLKHERNKMGSELSAMRNRGSERAAQTQTLAHDSVGVHSAPPAQQKSIVMCGAVCTVLVLPMASRSARH